MSGPTRRQALLLTGLGGLTTAGGLYWAYRPGGYLTQEARDLRALENDPMGAETILGHTAIHTDKPDLSTWHLKTPIISLDRYFRSKDDTPQDLKTELVSYAKKVGWSEKDQEYPDTNRWAGQHSNRTANDYMQLAITITTEHPDPSDPLHDSVAISLFYR